MKTNYSQVLEFHEAVDQLRGVSVKDNTNQMYFRMKLISEEYMEVMKAHADLQNVVYNKANKAAYIKAKADLLKELQDLKYVIEGLCITFGFDSESAFDRVHNSNMGKLDIHGKPYKDKDGKVMKSPNYQPPDLTDLVNEEKEVYETVAVKQEDMIDV